MSYSLYSNNIIMQMKKMSGRLHLFIESHMIYFIVHIIIFP